MNQNLWLATCGAILLSLFTSFCQPAHAGQWFFPSPGGHHNWVSIGKTLGQAGMAAAGAAAGGYIGHRFGTVGMLVGAGAGAIGGYLVSRWVFRKLGHGHHGGMYPEAGGYPSKTTPQAAAQAGGDVTALKANVDAAMTSFKSALRSGDASAQAQAQARYDSAWQAFSATRAAK
jgi:hypothetical protein